MLVATGKTLNRSVGKRIQLTADHELQPSIYTYMGDCEAFRLKVSNSTCGGCCCDWLERLLPTNHDGPILRSLRTLASPWTFVGPRTELARGTQHDAGGNRPNGVSHKPPFQSKLSGRSVISIRLHMMTETQRRTYATGSQDVV